MESGRGNYAHGKVARNLMEGSEMKFAAGRCLMGQAATCNPRSCCVGKQIPQACMQHSEVGGADGSALESVDSKFQAILNALR